MRFPGLPARQPAPRLDSHRGGSEKLGLALFPAVFVHGIHQRGDMLGRREL